MPRTDTVAVRVFAGLVLSVALTLSAVSQEKRLRAHRIDTPIEIDGRLDEPAWQQAEVIDDFVEQDPDEGEPPEEPTFVRVLYDDEKLYIGFDNWDSEPHRIVANEMRRDGALWQNDNVYVLLDTYGDRREGFFFRTNPLGAKSDSAVTDDGRNINGDWDCIWEAAGRIHENGWSVEIAIPFDQLRFEESEEMTWRVNFGRNIARTNSSAQWVPVPRTEGWMGTYRPTYTGRLEGLRGIRPSAHLAVKPYLLGGGSEALEEDRWIRTFERDVGLDVKYSVTPNLTLDLTVNTDFAQVEADREEVNLTRFDLFFPEKRDFFLEGSGLFAFGGGGGEGGPDVNLFYSRRIGIEDERRVPILGGAKLTGKVGAYGIGALSMMTDRTGEAERTSFSVIRLQRDIFERSTIGLIVTNRQTDLQGGFARNGGIDFVLRPTEQWRVGGFVAGSWTPDPDETGLAFRLSNDWRNDRFRVRASYMDIAPDFTAKMGFLRRSGYRVADGGVGYSALVRRFVVRAFDIETNGSTSWDDAGTVIGWGHEVGGGFQFESGDGIGGGFGYGFDHVDEPFTVGDAEIPAGDYYMAGFGFGGETNSTRPFSIGGEGTVRDFYGGNSIGFNVNGQWRATYQLALDLRYGWNRIDLPAYDPFTTNVFGTRISFSLNTRFFMKLFVQYNDTANRASANFLLNYIYRPGSDFYLVYDQRWDTSDGMRTRSWALLSKFTYYHSF